MKKFLLVLFLTLVVSLMVFANNDFTKPDGNFDWENYLNTEYYFKEQSYNTNALIRLFQHYDKVKDDPFSMTTLSNDIVSNIYNNVYEWGDYDTSRYFFHKRPSYIMIDKMNIETLKNKNMYKILYDNIDKFDVEYKVEKKQSMLWFLNDEINEVELFNEIRNAYLVEENKLTEINIINSDDKINGLTIKYNGRVVGGILGGRTDFEYTIDYNGKKDIKVKLVNMRITFLDKPSFYGAYLNDNDKPRNNYGDVIALIIGDDKYCMSANFYSTSVMEEIFETKKIRDFKNHEDGIVNIEIIE